ncbi:MAG TPA: LacI family DNA-binding transcriptional regulator [Chthoniobacteraceae bacterium]|nr:LacI family DNA-binding transcriptional regulator [Chthoniobacteraceae bacterium]
MPPRRKQPSLNVIAKEIGVSPATISRVLNGKPGIAEATRRKVLDALDARGYPKTAVRGGVQTLRNGSGTIAFAISGELRQRLQSSEPFYTRHLLAVQTACAEFGFYPILIDYEQDKTPNGSLRCVEEQRVFGIVASWMPPELVETVREHVGIVLFNKLTPVSGVDYVIPDIRQAVREQMTHLYDLGHRSVACFRPFPGGGWQSNFIWAEYWLQVHKLEMHNPPEFFEPIRFSVHGERPAMTGFLDRVLSIPNPPTAILTYDSYGKIFVGMLEERGLRVPEEISLVGFDDRVDFLSTYQQNFNGMAREALRALVDRSARPDLPGRVIEVEGKTIWRESVAPAPKR